MKKIFLLTLICLTLSSCDTLGMTKYLDIGKPVLEISKPEPLQLYPVNWDVWVVDKTPYFVLDTENFEKMVKNTELIQNRLYLQNKIIDNQTNYYKK